MIGRPSRRVILLGASNLVRSLSTVVATARQIWQQPVEIMAAIGHGRSYGRDSKVLGRKISGIFPCALWEDLQRRPALPTAALMTDIGNDLGYGQPPERIAEWVEACLDRLDGVGAQTIVTQLPLASLARLGAARYKLFRRLLFPSCRLPLAEIVSLAHELNARLVALGERRKIPVIPVSDAWYGLDPIHLKQSVRRTAWSTIVAPWCCERVATIAPRGSRWEWAYLGCLAPSERSILGWQRRAEQPSGVLRDGTTISLY
jgi:hypothetical protein